MTGSVWKGYRAAKPQSTVVQRSLFNKIGIQVTGFDGDIYGGNAVFPNLQ
jgi:adenylate cyclase